MSAHYRSISDKAVAEALAAGKIGVIPTDTLYGVVCPASNETAVRDLYALKPRIKKLGTIIAASIEQLVDLGFKARYLKAIEQYWPGAVSIVIPISEIGYLHQEVGSIPVRIPNSKTVIDLLKRTGPLLTTSANKPDQPPANNIKEAEQYFGDKVSFYVDGGDLSGRQPSTIMRIVDDAVEILREGAVRIDETGRIL